MKDNLVIVNQSRLRPDLDRKRLASGGAPLYQQVKKVLEEQILTGQFLKGTLLPPEQELCHTFAVSTITMRRALTELSRDGLIRRKSGIGTLVTADTKKIRFALLFLGFDSAEWLQRSEIFGSLLAGIGDAAWHANADFSTIRIASDQDARPILKMLTDEREVDGILLRSAGDIEDSYLTLLESRQLPYVVLKRHIEGRRMNFVTLNDVEASACATSHLINLGHRRIALISGARDISSRRGMYQGYRAALEEHGLQYDESLVHFTSTLPDAADGCTSMQQLLGLDVPPTAVFAAGDILAIGAMDALDRVGLRVPGDVAIVGYGDTQVARAVRPRLTSVRTPYDEIGRIATDALVRLIVNPSETPCEVFINVPLIVRESSGSAVGTSTCQMEASDRERRMANLAARARRVITT